MNATIKQRINMIRQRKVPDGHKHTRLGIIPDDWTVSPLNTVLEENKEHNRHGKYDRDDVLSVSGEFGVTNQIELLGRSYAGVSVVDYHVVEHGNIIYTKSPLKANPYGIIKQNKGEPGIVSTLYAVYHCQDYLTGTYLDYYFSDDRHVNNYLRPLVRKGSKNDMKINNKDVLRGDIVLPPRGEVKKIAEILGCCDLLIRRKKELIAEKKKQKKALMQKLLDPNSGFRLPRFSGEWTQKELEAICFINVNSLGEKEKPGFQFRYIDIATVDCGKLLNVPQMISFSVAPCRARRRFKKGDILFSTVRPYLRNFILVNFDTTEYIASTGFAVLSPRKGICNAFVYHQLFSNHIDFQINSLLTGTNYPALNGYDVNHLSFHMPPTLKEQQSIADILSAADREIDLLEQELAQQEKKKKSLMQLLLTGIVRVTA